LFGSSMGENVVVIDWGGFVGRKVKYVREKVENKNILRVSIISSEEGKKSGGGGFTEYVIKVEEGKVEGLREWNALALAPLHEAVSVLTSTRSDLLTAVDSFHGQSNALLALQQTLTTQQEATSHALLASHTNPSSSPSHTSLQPILEAVSRLEKRIESLTEARGGGADSTEWRKELTTLSTRLTDLHRHLTDSTASITAPPQTTHKGKGDDTKQRTPTPSLDSRKATDPASPARPSQVEGDSLRSIQVHLQQVWTMVAAILTLAVLLVAMRLVSGGK